MPGLSDAANSLAETRWFILGDLGSVVAAATTNVNVMTVLVFALVGASAWILWRTAFGLRLRSCGEAPHAAATLGVKVRRYKYVAVIVSGALAGLGGVYLAEVLSTSYLEGQTGGRGYIGLAAMIFGNWSPAGLAAGAGLFGFTDGVQLRAQETGVHALLLVIVFLIAAVAVWQGYRRRWVPA